MNFRITNGSVTYGADTILEEIEFEVKGREKIAIVGRNGAGKSTLLKAIVDKDLLSEGIGEDKFNIYTEGNPVIGYLKQIDFENEEITMLDEILKLYKDIIDLENKISLLLEKMKIDKSHEIVLEFSKAQDRYEFLNGYTYKKEYETAIFKFGFTREDFNKKISEFSGGQRTKIAFIKLLLSKPDILLLDEPTNHLDITTIEWLEEYLKSYPKAIVIVSHDRMFLNKIVNKVYEIEYGSITEYTGDYDYYEKQKKVNYERQLKDYEFQQKEIKRLTQIADRFRYKPTKSKMALSKLKQIERMVKLEEPNKYDLKTFNSNFELAKESGNNVLSIENLKFGYQNIIIGETSFKLYKGQKLAIIGNNGSGKSTLLKTIVGNIEKISGKIEVGHNVEIGYFDQKMLGLNVEKTIFDDFYDEFPKLTVTEIRNSLAAFLFYGDDVFKKIEDLSGGEKVRLSLAKILKKGPNLLVLDEPTNHMDILGKENLEDMLKEYKGTLLFVSHDRFFVSKIADSILAFENGKINYFECDYQNYLEKRSEIKPEKIRNEKDEKKVYQNPLKDRDRLVRKLEKIENIIDIKESEKNNLKQELLKEEVYSDYKKVGEIQDKISKLDNEITENMELWESIQVEIEEINKLIK